MSYSQPIPPQLLVKHLYLLKLVYSTSGCANKVLFHFTISLIKFCRPLGKPTVTDNGIHRNVQKCWKESVFHCFMMFFQYLQLKQVWEGTETCCSLCPQYLIKHFGTIVNQYEPVLKKLSVQVHGSDAIHFKGWFRFKSDKIMQSGSGFDLWFASKLYMKYGNITNRQCGEVLDKHSYVNTFMPGV
jgi:hypothetical protein